MSNVSAETLKSTIEEYAHGSDHPDLQVYRRDIDDKDWDRFSWWIGHVAELGHFYGGKRILEVGCGFGWDALALSKETDSTVVAMDILPSMIDGVQQCLTQLRVKGGVAKVEAMVGDVCEVDLPAQSFDGIFSSEAVEHVHSLEAMYARCFALLKPGGRLVIVNDSNAYNAAFRERNFTMWAERDSSWEHATWLKEEVRPIEHANAEPYGAMRERMIRAVEPGMGDDAVAKLVHATAGLIRPEIEQAAHDFKANGKLPVRPELSWCRNPETGEYAERLLDPFAMQKGLRDAGFKVSLQHLYRKFPFRLANNVGIHAVNKLLFKQNPLFVLVAQKPLKN
ncbi:class I SAM-dependent methyltransferase [Sphingomonas panacisoli]|uniref:Class I SAM-dependent methyltransferase n=1 Tax=Sphingomonas panacisoli TaxID=1813879 RepID=A0A5B8LLV5_9SPHN|nr:class I SAM-dependent methyltransferase [Sphingomonas panacisoli]QDZ08050.1 class I SAM-dependent methyltransferase [Sphingomonas panacisoli]